MGAQSNGPSLAFDVFGTLVDPAGVTEALKPRFGEGAATFAAEWRRTQVEYLIRHAAMGTYHPFPDVTAEALADCLQRFDVALGPAEREDLVDQWWRLPAMPDAAEALEGLAVTTHRQVAFSNGAAADVDALLQQAGLRTLLAAVHGVADAGTYKPAPAVYHHLAAVLGVERTDVWLVSANYWDALGARAAGLRSVWIARGRAPESWQWSPDLIVDTLTELAANPPRETPAQ